MDTQADSNLCHLFLAAGKTRELARHKAIHFLENTQLVVYHSITVRDGEIRSGAEESFWEEVEAGITANHAFCRTVLTELQETGLAGIEDLLTIAPGYPSKLLHILTHMLDGFFGTDSAFYNLVEDGHWLSTPLRAAILKDPEHYWLVPVWHGTATRALLHATANSPITS